MRNVHSAVVVEGHRGLLERLVSHMTRGVQPGDQINDRLVVIDGGQEIAFLPEARIAWLALDERTRK